ncbi:Sugar transferase involved in LPS biosynthesis (colanic, teichoic acid) [Alkalibacterium subtropicum]|uniref:Sugar transferase involved in LPS biosynthesis (Colanic, teichoic acid) n=1 Tax=Alkalibacterium subtropicum TaxID=753702 RepID=A0A1I1GKH1_9LACT|nr:sugar transferase [Alkalibacterium subtropicum]SFC09670.1 Sugar transferase involved in LPS biosynthesis (colanic, teichoic acid) [Alkalibacterium subtropicum]
MASEKTRYSTNSVTLELKENLSYDLFKRTLDITAGLFLILFLLPLLVVISVLVKIDDPHGKIFFCQERVGKGEKVFKMYKFRSMYSDAEKRLEELLQYNEMEGAMFKMKDDPRVTRVGKFLRALSLDELPQLINVVQGEMSLVGPRPPLIREMEEYTDYDKQRLMVKPGITGLWQVSGRSSVSFPQMVELDLEYIRDLSLKNDMIILLKTVKVVLKSEDAY